MDQATVKMTALQVIFDLLHLFGLDMFNVDAAAESTEDETSGNEQGKASYLLPMKTAMDLWSNTIAVELPYESIRWHWF